MIYGYARCSTNESKQDIHRQERELISFGVKKQNIFFEYESGTNRNRKELNRLLNIVKERDTIISTELSRITRSTKDLIEILEIAKNKKLKLILGSFEADCSDDHLDPMTEGMLKMMGVFAELERNITSERVKSGLKNATLKGKILGRPKTTRETLPQRFVKNYPLYLSGKINKSDLARICDLTRKSVYKYLKIIEAPTSYD